MKLSLKEFFAKAKTLKEYEDPTSSKRAEGDSQWSSPGAKQERVPHLNPQTNAQDHSAEGWEEVCDDGPKQSSQSDLKKFFGGEHAPKSSSGGKSSRKMSEGPAGQALNMRSQFGKKGTPGDPKKAERDFFGTSIGDPSNDQDLYPGVEKPYNGDDNEVPSGDLDDFGFTGGDEDYESSENGYEVPGQGVEPERGSTPFEPNWADTTFFNDEEPIKAGSSGDVHGGGFDDGEDMAPEEKMSEMGGPGSGRPKGSKNKPKDSNVGTTVQGTGTPADLPDEMPDSWFTDIDAMGAGEPKPDQPADPSGFEDPATQGEPDWASMDDEEFINQLAATDMSGKGSTSDQPKMADTIKTNEPSYDSFDTSMTWDEFRASDPELAAEYEERYDTNGATFKKKKSGFVHAKSPDGRRLFHMGDDRGWGDMDGDEPPGQSTGLGPAAPGEF
jgi:hypothetical protein